MIKSMPRMGGMNSRTSHSINMLIGLIRSGHLKSGDKLPPQDELARTLGISRTSLREALVQLSYRGIVESIHGRGTFVCDQGPHSENMMESRLIMEPRLAGLAAARGTATERDELAAMLATMEQFVATGDTVAFSDYDLQFHRHLALMTHNKALEILFNSLSDMLLHLQNIVQIKPGAMERAHEFHLEIFAAVGRKNGRQAEGVMRRHLEDVERALKEVS